MIEDIRYAPIVGRTHIFFHWVYYLKHIINICLQFKTKNGCVKILKGSPNYAYLPVDANHRKFFNFAGVHIYPGFVNQNRVAI